MDALAELNRRRYETLREQRDAVIRQRQSSPAPSAGDYPWARLRARIDAALKAALGDVTWELDHKERAKFGADIAIRVSSLLSAGPKAYIQEHVPVIVEVLRHAELADAIDDVQAKGIYVNVRLTERWFLEGVQAIIDADEAFGLSDGFAERRYVVDYSSPNVAKQLHAGHFRSTILGHVLCNLYAACGATVYRVNHINDFGGFGFILEGYDRFAGGFDPGLSEAEKLLKVYGIRRALERGEPVDPETDFEEFTAVAEERFQRLEQGDPAEVERWARMVDASLEGFQPFYDGLGIHPDFMIGESFYLREGNRVIDQALADGIAFRFGEEHIEPDPERTPQEAEALRKDIGAIVVPLPNGERLVARRSDGQSIYATRDLGAISVRRELFDPTDLIYVVGQEQRVHFARLFAAARVLGLATGEHPRFKHVSFGFYVDAQSGKKLSSRDSVAGVTELLAAAVEHFRAKSAQDGALEPEEVDEAGQQLAVGSVVFNDLKRDLKGAVPIPRGDLAPVLLDFEKSGGAYVAYAAARARAILRRYGGPVPRLEELDALEVNEQEAQLISRLLELPAAVARAARDDNPAVLVRHLLDVAALYHSYYDRAPVLKPLNRARLMITWATYLALRNGLRVCHVETPAKI